jgi:hypothetical protein
MKIQVSFPSHSLWATLFATVCFSQCCGSGSGRIDIILADPYPFQPIVKLKYFFPENVNMLFKLLKIWTPMTVLRKIKQCKLALLSMKVKNCFDFPTCVKLGVGSRSESVSASNGISDLDPDRLQNVCNSQRCFQLIRRGFDYSVQLYSIKGLYRNFAKVRILLSVEVRYTVGGQINVSD